jgi:FK506-binding protein 2
MQLRLFTFIPYLLLLAVGVAAQEKDVPELKIETTYKPPRCPLKTMKGDGVKVHYTGKLFSNGQKFDSSYDRETPLPVRLGAGQVIKGWDQGLLGMCLHEKRTLTIPSRLAYGSNGFGSVIPPNSALVFDVQLVGLEPHGKREDEL